MVSRHEISLQKSKQRGERLRIRQAMAEKKNPMSGHGKGRCRKEEVEKRGREGGDEDRKIGKFRKAIGRDGRSQSRI